MFYEGVLIIRSVLLVPRVYRKYVVYYSYVWCIANTQF